MVYNPIQYWEERGTHYSGIDVPKELDLFYSTVKNVLKPGDKILEVGSGYGRIYSYLQQTDLCNLKFTMCDFVDSFIVECKKRTGIKPDKWDGVTLPYSDSEFNLVISFAVLLHVPYDSILNTIKEHARVGKYLFIDVWYEEGFTGETTDHCFLHDYYNLFNTANLIILKEVMYSKTRRHWLLQGGVCVDTNKI